MARKGAMWLMAFTATVAASWALAQTPTVAPGPKVTITSITQSLPSLPQYSKVELPYYRDKVPQWSGGRIEFKNSTWAESGVSGSDILRLIRQGQADIGASPLGTVAGDAPFLEVADLAGLSPTVEQAQKIAAAVTGAANKQLEQFGIRIIATYPFPANLIFCRDSLSSLSDLKGRKVRTFGPSLADFVGELGAQAVSIGFPEVYPALERGVADCAITAGLSANAAKWFEVTRYMYMLPVSWGTGGYYVNLRWWNSLAPEVRSFVEKLYAMIEADEWALGRDGAADGLACNTGKADGCKSGTLVQKNPLVPVNPSPEDQAKLRGILEKTVVPAWVKRCGGERCAALFNEIVAPIVGFRTAAK